MELVFQEFFFTRKNKKSVHLVFQNERGIGFKIFKEKKFMETDSEIIFFFFNPEQTHLKYDKVTVTIIIAGLLCNI